MPGPFSDNLPEGADQDPNAPWYPNEDDGFGRDEGYSSDAAYRRRRHLKGDTDSTIVAQLITVFSEARTSPNRASLLALGKFVDNLRFGHCLRYWDILSLTERICGITRDDYEELMLAVEREECRE